MTRFLAPHSRHTEVPIDDIRACKDVTILAESDEAGFYLGMAEEGRKSFVMGHPEYDRMTLDGEYHRDKDKGLPIEIPKNYYKNDDPNTKPVLLMAVTCEQSVHELAELLCIPGDPV